jgi:hypothetical protein
MKKKAKPFSYPFVVCAVRGHNKSQRQNQINQPGMKKKKL